MTKPEYNFNLVVRCQILVTHHVDLVLPRAFYLVRMNNGRIDLHGEVASLISTGDVVPASASSSNAIKRQSDSTSTLVDDTKKIPDAEPRKGLDKKPAKLVQPETRGTGRIRWPVYKAYLKASYVDFFMRLGGHAYPPLRKVL